MAYNFNQLKEMVKQVEEWLAKELSSIRTSHATPAVLDSVLVDIYGSKMSIRELANITIEDPRTIRISPWDQSSIKSIEKAITSSSLGLSAVVDDKGLRLVFPELTGERRIDLVKLARQKLEEARKSLRKHREDIWEDIQTKEKSGGMSEDEKFRLKDEMQKIVDLSSDNLLKAIERKEQEIKS